MSAKKDKLIVILGPTSAGKTGLAVKLAKFFNGEIVSADSRQVYKGMDIGTGKDLNEYGNLPYHLIDVAKPKEQFSLAKFQRLAYKAIDNIIKKNKLPFLVGGSGLYIQAIVDGYQLSKTKPNKSLRLFLNFLSLNRLQKIALNKKIELNNSDFNNKRRLIRQIEIASNQKKFKPAKKPRYDCLLLGLSWPKPELDERIRLRLKHRLEKEGLIEEVKKIKDSGLNWQRLDDFGLEYRYVSKYLKNELSYNEMFDKLATTICQFAKRQITWYKRDKRINWIKNYNQAEKLIKNYLK